MADLLRHHTTLRVGGPAKAWVTPTSESELVEAVSAADQSGDPVLVLGGGSNLLVGGLDVAGGGPAQAQGRQLAEAHGASG